MEEVDRVFFPLLFILVPGQPFKTTECRSWQSGLSVAISNFHTQRSVPLNTSCWEATTGIGRLWVYQSYLVGHCGKQSADPWFVLQGFS